MNVNNPSATESQAGPPARPGLPLDSPSTSTPAPTAQPPQLKVGKSHALVGEAGKLAELEVFTLSLGAETISLVPFRNWSQLDAHKWTMRGKLPETPAGLEITPDHVKLLGQTVSIKEPDGCPKLEKLFAEWLALELQTRELARKKAQARPSVTVAEAAPPPTQQPIHFHVEVDKAGHVHIQCLQGKEQLAVIGLNQPGFAGLYHQGMMRRPHSLQTGVMHNWVELDGVLFSFEKGNNDAAKLEQALNERYAPQALGLGKEVVVLPNPASSTGFDIQFPVMQAGVRDNHRRALNEEALELLQDQTACGLLHKNLIIKLARPNLIFKQKTPDGGETYLARSPQNLVTLTDEDGNQKTIDLSQPLNYLRVSAPELTAVFNHPAINRHGQAAPTTTAAGVPPVTGAGVAPTAGAGVPPAQPPPTAQAAVGQAALPKAETQRASPLPDKLEQETQVTARETGVPPAQPPPTAQAAVGQRAPPKAEAPSAPLPPVGPAQETPLEAQPPAGTAATAAPARPAPLPNLWMQPLLSAEPMRHDWFAFLAYRKMAERFGNSGEGHLGRSGCWFSALGEATDLEDPFFKGIFVTEKGGLGFLNAGQMARFNQEVAFIGTRESALEGIGVRLLGLALDAAQSVIFVVNEGYGAKFGVQEPLLAQELARLKEHGALVMSVKEVLASREPVEVLWTVPALQPDPLDPQALESPAPAA